jgi:hypothetical protein
MVFKGIVENGSVKLPPEAELPDGTEVRVEPADQRPLMDLVRRLESLEDDPDWPEDGAAEHDHYLYGTPKRYP